MRKYFIGILFTLLVFISCNEGGNKLTNEFNLIPLPNEISTSSGKLILQDKVTLSMPSEIQSSILFDYFKDVLKNTTIKPKKVVDSSEALLKLTIDNSISDEEYNLDISTEIGRAHV